MLQTRPAAAARTSSHDRSRSPLRNVLKDECGYRTKFEHQRRADLETSAPDRGVIERQRQTWDDVMPTFRGPRWTSPPRQCQVSG